MKTNASNTASIFRDQPLSDATRPAPLYAAGRDHDDAFDTFLRGLLVACTISALALVGLEMSAPATAAPAPQTVFTATPAPHAVTASVQTAPAAKVCTHI